MLIVQPVKHFCTSTSSLLRKYDRRDDFIAPSSLFQMLLYHRHRSGDCFVNNDAFGAYQVVERDGPYIEIGVDLFFVSCDGELEGRLIAVSFNELPDFICVLFGGDA